MNREILSPFTLLRIRIDSVFAEYQVQRQSQIQTSLSVATCPSVAASTGLLIVDPFSARKFIDSVVIFLPF